MAWRYIKVVFEKLKKLDIFDVLSISFVGILLLVCIYITLLNIPQSYTGNNKITFKTVNNNKVYANIGSAMTDVDSNFKEEKLLDVLKLDNNLYVFMQGGNYISCYEFLQESKDVTNSDFDYIYLKAVETIKPNELDYNKSISRTVRADISRRYTKNYIDNSKDYDWDLIWGVFIGDIAEIDVNGIITGTTYPVKLDNGMECKLWRMGMPSKDDSFGYSKQLNDIDIHVTLGGEQE